MAEPHRHHFIPVFYLKKWCLEDRKLVEFSKPYNNILKTKRVHPRATGYVDRLYEIEGFPAQVSQDVETTFLSPVDNGAASALSRLLETGSVPDDFRRSWSQFIVSLLMRTPAEVALLKVFIRRLETDVGKSVFQMLARHIPANIYDELQIAIDEQKRSILSRSVQHMINLLSMNDIADRISTMEWGLVDLDQSTHELLTCDHTVIVVRSGLPEGSTIIALPVARHSLFVAATEKRSIEELKRKKQDEISKSINTDIVSGARKYVYGSSDDQLRFIKNRFNKEAAPSFVEQTLVDAGTNIDQTIEFMANFFDAEAERTIRELIAGNSKPPDF